MNISDYSVKNFITIVSIASLFLIFGIISFKSIPIQLVPTVDKPEIAVITNWSGASPEEIESEIVIPQEDKLKSLEGLDSIESTSIEGKGEITLKLKEGRNVDATIIRVSNLLSQVKDLPFDSDKPIIRSVSSDASPIAWFILKAKSSLPIHEYKDFAEDFIKTRFERVPGVGASNVLGGRSKQVHIVIDNNKIALMGLSLIDISNVIRDSNADISSGAIEEGKRKYLARTTAEFTTLSDIGNLVVRKIGNNIVRLKDISNISFTYEDEDYLVRHLGNEAIAINAVKETGANTIEVFDKLLLEMDSLNKGILQQNDLKLTNVYSDTFYINSSINFVKQNLIFGAILAIIILLLFLKSFRTALIISVAIPTSIISSFIVFDILGRTINLISLAGMSFAVGMVLDNSLVVLENIFSKIEAGIRDVKEACVKAAQEVSGAIFASSLTTIVVFIPIFFLTNETGQLFKDIAIAISVSIFLSLLVSLTLIPGISSRILGSNQDNTSIKNKYFLRLFRRLDSVSIFIKSKILSSLEIVLNSERKTFISFFLIITLSLFTTYKIFPKIEYLPEGNRNLIISILIPPQGYNIEKIKDVGKGAEKKLEKFWKNDGFKQDGIANFFFVARPSSVFMGAVASKPSSIRRFIPELRNAVSGNPGFITIVNQSSLFSRSIGERRSVEIDIQGADYDSILSLSRIIFAKLSSSFLNFQIRPKPSLSNSNPEIEIRPKNANLEDVGLTSRDLGLIANIVVDGALITKFNDKGNEIDVQLRSKAPTDISTHDINTQFIYHNNKLFPVSHVASVGIVNSAQQINHVEQQRTIKLQISPDEGTNIEEAVQMIEKVVYSNEILQIAKSKDLQIKTTGIVGKLRQAKESLSINFIYAFIISYFLLASLFQSFIYPIVVLTIVPLSSLGGLLGLKLLNLFAVQPLNMLTMLGFIILLGIVVNNSILIVYRALNYFRSGEYNIADSSLRAVKDRIRPIFMTTFTTIFGLLPLALLPGSGSELYRGLGIVILSGLLLATFFTLFLTPISIVLINKISNFKKQNVV